MTDTEVWRPVPGYPMHEASNTGQIRRLDFTDAWGRIQPGRVLRQSLLNYSPKSIAIRGYSPKYMRVSMKAPDKPQRTMLVHRVVAAAFHGPAPEGHVVRHLDGDSLNNLPENLAYGTESENAYDTVRHGTNSMTRRTHCVNGHEFTPENTRIDRAPDGSFRQRRCRACARAGQAARYAAQRAEVAR